MKKIISCFVLMLMFASSAFADFSSLTKDERAQVMLGLKQAVKYTRFAEGKCNIKVLAIEKLGSTKESARYKVSVVFLIDADKIFYNITLDLKYTATNKITWLHVAVPIGAFILGALIFK